ncbi:MAG: hypothetical protein PHY02_03510 [Phycisphaerae bacterium]|nr:hypothetical protein [Phycisphaerae bacterium]
MIAHNHKSLCREAELYYYDFLCNESGGFVPESIVSHIEQCQYCLEQINQLEAELSQTDSPESEQGRVNSTVTTMLKLHFAYIGKPVTCNIVKPFLPTLLDQVLGIHIPTPIVTHLCDCQQCSEDLDTIQRLNLSRKQLCRLSQLFAEKSAGGGVSCMEAQNAIPSVVSMVFSETDLKALKHLCTCPVCRTLIYEERQKLCDSLSEDIQSSEFLCESVSASDFFDYVVPYGINPADDQYAKFRESFTSHVINCLKCLAKMQELHKAIYGICERAESGIITIYHVDESAKAQALKQPDVPYIGFPVRVGVSGLKDAEAESLSPTIGFGAALKQKVLGTNLKPLLKTGAVAAAVIFIAAALLLNIPTAKAVTLERIYEAIEKIKNVYISSFVPDKTEPTQEKWVSRTLNSYMTKTAERCVFYDITDKTVRIKHLDTDVVDIARLTAEDIAGIENKIIGSLGLVPFYDISNIPQGADWNRVTDQDSEFAAKGLEVYDLAWTETTYGGSAVLKKWRFFVSIKTNLPQKIEIYQLLPAEAEYVLMSFVTVEYLDDTKILSVIKEASF